jgi:hypothetical protein
MLSKPLWCAVVIAVGIACFALALDTWVSGVYECASVGARPVCGLYLIASELLGPQGGVVTAILLTSAAGVFLCWVGISSLLARRES